jgi:hypothetical protein
MKETVQKKPRRRAVKSLRGPRTAADQSAGKWGLTIRETEYGARGYRWKTFLVQGWQDERGRWCRKKFKEREAAEAFVALKRVELATADRLQPVLTTRLPGKGFKEILLHADGGIRSTCSRDNRCTLEIARSHSSRGAS